MIVNRHHVYIRIVASIFAESVNLDSSSHICFHTPLVWIPLFDCRIRMVYMQMICNFRMWHILVLLIIYCHLPNNCELSLLFGSTSWRPLLGWSSSNPSKVIADSGIALNNSCFSLQWPPCCAMYNSCHDGYASPKIPATSTSNFLFLQYPLHCTTKTSQLQLALAAVILHG